jgi:hypothetical protein
VLTKLVVFVLARRFTLPVGLCALGVACSSGESPDNPGKSVGGSAPTSTGGSGGTTGGAKSASGGTSTGGAVTGGATSTGGAVTGGTAPTGGSSTGGTSGSASGGAATAGSGGAAGGSTAGAAGETSGPVTPIMVSASNYRFTMGDVVLDVNPQVGGRVSKLTFSAAGAPVDVIRPYTCTSYDPNSACNNSGSTFWTSPQSAWDGVSGGDNVWPPVAASDGSPYTPAVTDNHLVLTGSADATLGASVKKDISADSATGWITVAYTITATKAIQVAPWQITRVPRGGLVLFPIAASATVSNPTSWTLSASNDLEWLDDSTQTSITSAGPKIVADGGAPGQSYTWLAYALSGNLLLIKYPDVASSAFAPNEGDTEIFPGDGYIELEPQGAYGSLAANASVSWTVQWRVVAIPGNVTASAGSETLAAFAQQQAAL